MRYDIIDRLRTVVYSVTTERRRMKELEEECGIPVKNWKNFWSRRQRPTAHMIEAICRRWPEYAFWIATGISDEEHGHLKPKDAYAQDQSGYLCESTHGKELFNLKLCVQDFTYGMSEGLSRDWVEDKNPTPEDAEQVRKYNEDPRMVSMFGQMTATKPKYSDLDMAIARLAFTKNLARLGQHYRLDITRSYLDFRSTLDAVKLSRDVHEYSLPSIAESLRDGHQEN